MKGDGAEFTEPKPISEVDALFRVDNIDGEINLSPDELGQATGYFVDFKAEFQDRIDRNYQRYNEAVSATPTNRIKRLFHHIPPNPDEDDLVKRWKNRVERCNQSVEDLKQGKSQTAESMILEHLRNQFGILQIREHDLNYDYLPSLRREALNEVDSALNILFMIDHPRAEKLLEVFEKQNWDTPLGQIFTHSELEQRTEQQQAGVKEAEEVLRNHNGK